MDCAAKCRLSGLVARSTIKGLTASTPPPLSSATTLTSRFASTLSEVRLHDLPMK